ncbi:MAG: 6-carboxytetrahydropterin synthase QueD [Planctomycetota bacterium]
MYILQIEGEFAAAHRLREYQGNCERLHGHNYRVQARITAEELNAQGLVMDFREAKGKLGEAIEALDHRYLNEVPPFEKTNPSTENLARFLYEALAGRMGKGRSLESVTVWESAGCSATYTGEKGER